MKWGCRGHWGHWGCWGCRGHWGCKGSKAWKITTDDCRITQVPEFILILMFWEQIFFVRIMKHQVKFWHLLSWRVLRPAYVTFFLIVGWNTNLLKPLSTIIQQNYWSFFSSEPFSFGHFDMIRPDIHNFFFGYTLVTRVKRYTWNSK